MRSNPIDTLSAVLANRADCEASPADEMTVLRDAADRMAEMLPAQCTVTIPARDPGKARCRIGIASRFRVPYRTRSHHDIVKVTA